MKDTETLRDTSPPSRAAASREDAQRRSIAFPAPGAPVQMTTSIKYGNLQEIHFGSKKGHVGTTMSAYLDPQDERTGTDTSSSSAFSGLFNELQANTNSTWVRGHLLNHDLGGIAHFNNLFPITTAANGEHKFEVEYPVKHWLNNDCEIQYDMQAIPHAPFDTTCANGSFVCSAEVKKGHSDFKGKKVDKTIHSLMTKKNWTRKLEGNKSKQTNSFAETVHGNNNDIFRDTYGSAKARSGWEHDTGSSNNNYALLNNERYDLTLDELKELQAYGEDEIHMLGDILEGYNVIGPKGLVQSEIQEIIEYVQSEASDYDTQVSIFIEELEDHGYTVTKK